MVYLVKIDRQEIKDGFAHNTAEHDWLSGAMNDERLLERAADMVFTKSIYITEQANQCGFQIVDMGKGFDEKINKLLQEF